MYALKTVENSIEIQGHKREAGYNFNISNVYRTNYWRIQTNTHLFWEIYFKKEASTVRAHHLAMLNRQVHKSLKLNFHSPTIINYSYESSKSLNLPQNLKSLVPVSAPFTTNLTKTNLFICEIFAIHQ